MNKYDREEEPTVISLLSEIIEITIRHIYLHPVTFELIYTDFDSSHFDGEYTKKEKKFLEDIMWDTLIVDENLVKARGFTDKNGNDDNRGGGCGNLKIPVEDFTYTIKNDSGITVRDITEIAYRLKGSKYDWWYELFYGIKIKKLTDDKIVFRTDYGYGS